MILATVFKFIDWLKKSLKWIKDIIDLAKWIVMIFLAISSFAGVKSCSKQKEQKENIVSVLNHNIETYKTESGKNASEVKNWQLKYNDLEKINGEISQENGSLKNELIEARKTINDAKINEKRLKNYIKTELVSKDSINTQILFMDKPCRFKIEPIETKHLIVNFKQSEDYTILGIDHEYRTDIKTIISMYKDPDQFFLWRWIKPKYKDKTTTIVDDPKATIENMVEITFE